jgi:RNA polymerase sporulation-specific sigma factor
MKNTAERACDIELFLPIVMSEAKRFSGGDLFTREDLAQEGIIAALRALDTYDPARGSIEGYVRTCARNRMISYLRRSWQEFVMDDEALNASALDSDPTSVFCGEPQERIEIGEALSKLIAELSAFEKSVLYSYLSAGSLSEAALLLECDRKKVDNALQRIRNKARMM